MIAEFPGSPLTFKVRPGMVDKLDLIADRRKITRSELIRVALEQLIAQELVKTNQKEVVAA